MVVARSCGCCLIHRHARKLVGLGIPPAAGKRTALPATASAMARQHAWCGPAQRRPSGHVGTQHHAPGMPRRGR